MNQFKRSFLLGATAMLAAATAAIPQAQASTFVISGAATNYAVLYEGGGGKQLQTTGGGNCGSSCSINGNIGIGGTGTFSDSGLAVNGTVQFAQPTGSYSVSGGGTVSGGATYGNTNVQTTLNSLNTLSTTLGGETGTSLGINTGGSGGSQTINITNGVLHAGVEVFTISSLQFNNNTTLNIVGDAAGDSVVFNIGSNAQFGGTIDLTGLLADQVLFNIIGGANLTGGPNLQDSANGATLAGDFLDPNGTIQINEATIDGRVFGGGSSNMQIVSGGQVDAPLSETPLPGALPLMGTVLGAGYLVFMWRRRHGATGSAAFVPA